MTASRFLSSQAGGSHPRLEPPGPPTSQNTGSATTAHRTLAAGTSEEWVDVLVSVLGLQPSAQVKGLLAVASSEPLAISCRTYNQETATRTYGQQLRAKRAVDHTMIA